MNFHANRKYLINFALCIEYWGCGLEKSFMGLNVNLNWGLIDRLKKCYIFKIRYFINAKNLKPKKVITFSITKLNFFSYFISYFATREQQALNFSFFLHKYRPQLRSFKLQLKAGSKSISNVKHFPFFEQQASITFSRKCLSTPKIMMYLVYLCCVFIGAIFSSASSYMSRIIIWSTCGNV
jgi:hypothetical protein